MAKDYQKEIDFAFFVVNFGYSKSDYEMLTPCEKAFIYKAWENKAVSDSTMFRDAALNAISNAFRKKNKRFIRLWKKKQKKANKDVIKENLHVIEEAEKKEGKGWVDLIYQTNGFTPPRRKGGRKRV